MKQARLLVLVLVGGALVACASPTAVIPTNEEARQYLATAVDLAKAGQVEALCAIGGLNCQMFLDEDGDSAPRADPTIVGMRTRPQSASGLGGVVLELCGKRDDGSWYYSEMLVFHDAQDGNRLKAIEPVYWAGILMPDTGNVGTHINFDPALRCDPAPT